MLAVAAVAVVERFLMFAFYPPVAYDDTPSYRHLAATILNHWQGYDGTRTPGYPIFLAWVGPDRWVYLLQLGMGLAITLVFFWVGWQASGKARFGAAAALAHTLNLGQLFFEANLLTETLTTFLLALSVLAVFEGLRRRGWIRLAWALAGGLFGGLAGLVRPLFFFVPFWMALFFPLAFWREGWRVRLGNLFAPLLPGLIIAGLWVGYIDTNFHILSVTVMNGYHLVQHTGYFFEYVPDEDAALRDTYLRYRAERIARYGTQGNTIWDAIPELEKVTGLSFYNLSQKMASISIELIREHPGLYLRTVVSGWFLYWRAPVYWDAGAIAPPGLRVLLQGLVTAERLALVAFNLTFILGSLVTLLWKRFRQIFHPNPVIYYLTGLIWLSSIAQTLPDHGDNPRFLIPLQSWVVFCVLWFGFGLRDYLRQQRKS
ncbi:hypothetical protein LARV_01695 [Longilinea arvoryzae]|uniref:Glycosyltransferase RgtA/B/C/D-like domain-containing protein n=1 Tax=Longilinea arvoryzae TaxID=360412 RepID=A0A0S7BFX3_9CHLR|nr:hypothetical protein LARV_01695 [Longilinea arvoryzae]